LYFYFLHHIYSTYDAGNYWTYDAGKDTFVLEEAASSAGLASSSLLKCKDGGEAARFPSLAQPTRKQIEISECFA
jgi:hypothetical protein